jgi:PAS domain S-box-containing protein
MTPPAEQPGETSASQGHPQLYAEQVQLLYKNAVVGLIATLINSAILVFILRSKVPHRVLTVWLVCILAVSAGRFAQFIRFRRLPRDSSDVGHWGTWFIIGMTFSGIVWGAAGVFLFPVESIIHQAFVAFVLGGMAIGAAGAFSIVLPAFIAFILPSLAPIIVRFLAAGDEMHLAMGAMSLLFFVLTTGIAVHINRETAASLRLRFENSSLISYLSSAKDDLEKLNRELSSENRERRRAEGELKRHRDHLEELVDNRTAELKATNDILQQEISERMKTEEQLLRSESKYRTIFQTTPVSLWEEDFSGVRDAISNLKDRGIRDFRNYFDKNPDFLQEAMGAIKILDVNDATLALYGAQSKEELILSLERVFTPESHRAFKEALIAIAEGKTSFETEAVTQTLQGGRPLHVFMSMTIPRETSEFRNLLVSIIDITERKKLQDLISLGKKEWEETFDVINDAITILNTDFTIVRANKAAERLLGLSFREIIGRKCHQLYHGSDSPPEGCASCLAMKMGMPFTIETFEPHLDKFLEIKAFPQVDEDNNVLRLVHVIRDVTERKRIENALRDSERLLRESQEAARIGSYALDVKSGIWRSSQVLDGILGIGKEYPHDIGGWVSLVHPHYRAHIVEYFTEEVIRKKQRFDRQYKIVRQTDYEERWVQGLGDLEFDEKGDVIRIVGTIQDITEKKKTETEILKAQKIESIGILAAGIAHDFNNLLQAIMGNISLAKMLTTPHSRIFPLLEESERASEQARELSYQLLTFSKGGGPVKGLVSIAILLKEAASLSLSGSNVACELNLPEGLDLIEVDEGQIKQVFHNLLINAKEAMPEGGKVRISAAKVRIGGSDKLPLKEGPHVRISVADHGVGIPDEIMPKIFDPYFSTKERGSDKGMGLGLAICHSIISKHEGHITVESEVGVGTTFHIYLPSCPQRIIEEITGKDEGLFAGRGRVLLMDDDEGVRRIAGAMLQQLGYDVDYARNGEEAIERYRRGKDSGKRIDAVILDLTVQGGMGGEKALGKLREIDPELKAVISSGYADNPVMKDFRAFGFLGAIAKPYTFEKLAELLGRIEEE